MFPSHDQAEKGEALDKLVFDEVDIVIEKGEHIRLGESIIVCASVWDDVNIWLPFLRADMKFYPLPDFSKIFLPGEKLCIHPSPEICSMMIQNWKAVNEKN